MSGAAVLKGFATGVALLLVAGCGGGPAPAPAPAPFVLPSAAAALTPALYVQTASDAALFAVRASELAAARGSGRTRTLAEAIRRDQQGIAAQLSFAGRRLDLLPDASVSPALSAELDRLAASPSFDSDYRRAVSAALGRALDAHQAFARGGGSATLRPVAQMAAPVTRRNVEALRR